MCQGFSHFLAAFFASFVWAKLATTSIRVNGLKVLLTMVHYDVLKQVVIALLHADCTVVL